MFDVIVFNNTNLRKYFEVIIKQKRSSILGLTVFVTINLFEEYLIVYKLNHTNMDLILDVLAKWSFYQLFHF